MSRGTSLLVWIAALATALAPAAGAQGPPPVRVVRAAEALALAARHNPDLKIALLAERRAAADVGAEAGVRPFVLEVDGGYTRSSSPRAGADGEVGFATGDSVAVGGQVSKATAVGTEATIRVDGSAAPDDPTAYGLAARLSVTQPLLRGAGREVNEAGLRQARDAEAAARLAARRTASENARDVLVAYWELWYAARALEIEARARDVAKLAIDEVRARIESGAAAPVDALPYETNLAALEEGVVAAAAEDRRLALSLAVLLGLAADGARLAADPADAPPDPGPQPAPDDALRAALADSPEIREAAAAVAAAEERALVAGEAMRQRLDLVGWIGAQTMGLDEVSPAFAQLGQGAAYSGYVGLVWELPLSDARKDAQRAGARLDVEIARERLAAAGARIRAEVIVASDAIESARRKVALAEQTLAAARRQAEAERQRYAAGASIYIEVRDAEEAERAAQLRTVRARVDLAEAKVRLDHLTGALLAGLGAPAAAG